jgi:uncharacterized membrane protein YraQ (UPF0718 family)
MGPNLIAAIASVLVIAITVIGQWINSRNDRNLTNQEVDILKKLDSNSTAARELSQVIQFRIAKWHRRIAKSRQLLRGTIVWGVVGYLMFLAAVQLRVLPRDSDLMLLLGALILFGSVAFAIAIVRLVQFLKRHRQERDAAG